MWSVCGLWGHFDPLSRRLSSLSKSLTSQNLESG